MKRRVMLAGLISLTVAYPLAAGADKKPAPRDPKELGQVVIFPFLERAGGNEYRQLIIDEVSETLTKRKVGLVPRENVAAAMRKLELSADEEQARTPTQLKRLAEELGTRYVITGVLYDAKVDFQAAGSYAQDVVSARIQFKVFDAMDGHFLDELERTVTAAPKGLGLRSRTNQKKKAVQEATRKSMETFLAPYPEKR